MSSTLGLRINQNMSRADAIERNLVAMDLRLFPIGEPIGVRASIELTALFDDGTDLGFHNGTYELTRLDFFTDASQVHSELYNLFAEIYTNSDARSLASDRMFGNTEYISGEAAAVIYRWLCNRATDNAEPELTADIPF